MGASVVVNNGSHFILLVEQSENEDYVKDRDLVWGTSF